MQRFSFLDVFALANLHIILELLANRDKKVTNCTELGLLF